MKNNIDNVVKKALLDEVKEISDTEDIFFKIEEEINTESVREIKSINTILHHSDSKSIFHWQPASY
jgi:hypothetical protein